MIFTVKYRAKNGSVADETIEAVDRADCIAKCRARGTIPISVMKGCGKGKNEKTNFIPKTPNRKTIFAAALLIAVGAVLLLNITGSASYRNTESARNRKTKEHIKATARAETGCVEKSDTATNSLRVTTAIQKTDAVSEEKRPDDEALRKKWKEKFARHRSIFSNASDQILGMIVNTPPGRDMPPMPITRSIDRDFMKSLETPIVINETDSDEIKATKQAVIELRAEVLAIKESQNLTVYEILTQHQNLMQENAKIRKEVQKEAVELYKSGDVEGAREFVDKVNTKLDRLGAEQIKMPGTQNPELRQRMRDSLNKLKNRKNPKRN